MRRYHEKTVESTILENNKKRIFLFLAGFALFWLVGGLVRGDMGDLTVYSRHWFVDLGYKTLAAFFRRSLGLPVGSGFGYVFSLIASIFYLVCGVRLYTAPSTYDSDDFSTDTGHGIIPRGAHFICCYCFLPLVSFVMVDWDYFAVVNDTRTLAAIGFAIFLLYLLVSLILFFKEPEDVCRMKWLTRFLSSFALMLGVSGISRFVWELGLAKFVFLPSFAVGWMNRLAAGPDISLWYVLLLFLVMAVLVVICIFCAFQLGKRALPVIVSAFGPLALCFFAMKFYGGHADTGLDYRALTQWVLILVMSVIWGAMSEEKVLPIVLCTMGLATALLALFRAAGLFYAPVDRLLEQYSEKAAPLQDAAWAWGSELIPVQVVLMLVVFAVTIVAMLLTSVPYCIQKKPMIIPKGLLRLLSQMFCAGIVLRFMGQDWVFVSITSYILIAVPLTGLMASLIGALLCRDLRSVFWILYAVVTTAVVAIPFLLYAYVIGFILIGIFVALNTIGMVIACCQALPSIARGAMQKEMLDELGAIDSAVEAGDLTLMQGASLASSMLDAYTPLL